MSNGSNNTLKYVAIGCASIIGFLCCCCGGGLALMYPTLAGPYEASHGFFTSVRAQNYQEALGRMSSGYQQTHDLASFTSAVQSMPALAQHTDATLSNIQVQNTTAHVTGTLTTPAGAVPVDMNLSASAGGWTIDTLVINGQPLP